MRSLNRNDSSQSLKSRLQGVLKCPCCESGLEATRDSAGDGSACAGCGAELGTGDGILDLVLDPELLEEREHYDRQYNLRDRGRISPRDLEATWNDPARPIDQAILRRLGRLEGKRVLVLGGGESVSELYFLTQDPEMLIISDLSIEGVRSCARTADLTGYTDRVAFAAMNALDLPVQDGSVDLVYGNAVVHHLSDRQQFLAEVVRVLAPGGKAVFLDDAYSPLWQRAKLGFLRPMMRASHRFVTRSPEDVEHTAAGGFREDELERMIRGAGGIPFFQRHELVLYLWQRAAEVAFPARSDRMRNHRKIAPALHRLDGRLRRFESVRRNQIRLIWGLERPRGPARSLGRSNGIPARGHLPTFVVIGAAKAGTTALYEYLAGHPQVHMSPVKEPHFFGTGSSFFSSEGSSLNVSRVAELEGYKRLFETPLAVRGEASPSYTMFPIRRGVPQQIHRLVPDAKLIYLVRDPIARAISHYYQRVSTAVVADTDLERTLLEAIERPDRPDADLLWASMYMTQINQFRDHFPDDSLLIVDQHRLAKRREATLREVFEFLGVDPDPRAVGADRVHNVTAGKRAFSTRYEALRQSIPARLARRGRPQLSRRLAQPLRHALSPELPRVELSERAIAELRDLFEPEVEGLRRFSGQSLESWSL